MNTNLVERLETKLLETYLRAQEVYRRNFELPKIEFGDMGRVAGKAFFQLNKVKFSPTLFAENVETFLARTVPHEAAHLITWTVYPNARQHHGPEWRSVMSKLGVTDIGRCHSYDVSSVANVRPRPFAYKCGCNVYKLTSNIHNKIVKGQRRVCGRCSQTVVFAGVVQD